MSANKCDFTHSLTVCLSAYMSVQPVYALLLIWCDLLVCSYHHMPAVLSVMGLVWEISSKQVTQEWRITATTRTSFAILKHVRCLNIIKINFKFKCTKHKYLIGYRVFEGKYSIDLITLLL